MPVRVWQSRALHGCGRFRPGYTGGMSTPKPETAAPDANPPEPAQPPPRPKEIGGPAGPEPTRYGDWERNGRCSDF